MTIVKSVQRAWRTTRNRFSVMWDLFSFLWERKMWWLLPMVAALMLFGVLVILAQSSAVAPFIYTLF